MIKNKVYFSIKDLNSYVKMAIYKRRAVLLLQYLLLYPIVLVTSTLALPYFLFSIFILERKEVKREVLELWDYLIFKIAYEICTSATFRCKCKNCGKENYFNWDKNRIKDLRLTDPQRFLIDYCSSCYNHRG